MRIASGGNVGIGTTSPSYKLEVNGTAYIGGTFYTNTTSYLGGLVRLVGTTSSDSQLDLPIDYGALRWYDGSTFKGGIGTSGWSGLGSGNDLGFYLNSGNFHIGNGSNPFVTFDKANERVGIGTTSPSAKLQVQHNGDNGSGGDSNYAILAHASSGQATIGVRQTNNGYANLNLGGSSNFWHISKRISSENYRLEYYWFNGSTFTSCFKFETNGNFTATGDVIAYSDARVKENVVTIDNALDKVKEMRGVYYNRTDQEDDKSKKVGVIAQEIEKVLPEVVSEDGDGMKGVSYGNIVGVLIEAIKDQQKQIDELKARLDGSTK